MRYIVIQEVIQPKDFVEKKNDWNLNKILKF